jgi:hypothetical protein
VGEYSGGSDLPTAHHAGPGKESVVDRVGLDVAVAVLEHNLDDNQVVDVVQVFPNALLCVSVGVDSLEDEVTRRSTADLANGMACQGILALIPLDADPLVLDVEVMLAHVIEEVTGIGGVKERHGNSPVMGAQEDIQQNPTPDSISDVGMRGALGQVGYQDSSGALLVELRGAGLLERDIVGSNRAACNSVLIAVLLRIWLIIRPSWLTMVYPVVVRGRPSSVDIGIVGETVRVCSGLAVVDHGRGTVGSRGHADVSRGRCPVWSLGMISLDIGIVSAEKLRKG